MPKKVQKMQAAVASNRRKPIWASAFPAASYSPLTTVHPVIPTKSEIKRNQRNQHLCQSLKKWHETTSCLQSMMCNRPMSLVKRSLRFLNILLARLSRAFCLRLTNCFPAASFCFTALGSPVFASAASFALLHYNHNDFIQHLSCI